MKYFVMVLPLFLILKTSLLRAQENCEQGQVAALADIEKTMPNCYASNSFFDLNFTQYQNDLNRQKSTCECILKNSKSDSSSKDLLSNKDYLLAHLERSADKIVEQSQISTNMALLRVHTLDPQLAEEYQLDKSYDPKNAYAELIFKESSKRSGLNDEGIVKELFDKSVSKKTVMTITNVMNEKPVENETCYPMQRYLYSKAFPSSPAFYRATAKSFKQEDWDINALKNKFLYEETNGEEREQIYTKIEFLEKNPILKYSFKSRNSDTQKKAFALLKKSTESFRCNEKMEAKCDVQFFDSGHTDKFSQAMKSFMADPAIIAATKEGREQEFTDLISIMHKDSVQKIDVDSMDTFAEKTLGISLRYCQLSLSGDHTLNSVLNDPLLMMNMSSPLLEKRMSEARKDVEAERRKCDQLMPQYCSNIPFDAPEFKQATIKDPLSSNTNELNGLYQFIREEMNPDPIKNTRYANDTAEYCANESRIFAGEAVDFKSFKAKFCLNSQNEETCGNKNQLFSSFNSLERDNRPSEFYFSKGSVGSGSSFGFDLPELSEEQIKKYESSISHFDKSQESRSLKADSSEIAKSNSLNAQLNSQSPETASAGSAVVQAPVRTSNDHSYALNSAREIKEGLDEEIRVTKDSLAFNKQRLLRENTTPEFRDEVEQRIISLEGILADKEKSSKDFQNIISKLIDNKNRHKNEQKEFTQLASLHPRNVDKDLSMAGERSQSSPVFTQQKYHESSDSSRTPASVGEVFSTSGGTQGGAGSVGRSSLSSSSAMATKKGSAASGKVNSALLAKYGITVQDSEENVQVATEKEHSQVSNLLSNAGQSDLGLEVSRLEYEKFKNNDVSALNKLYEEKIEMLETDVVKLLIRSQGEDESLEFYAIKEDGKVIFQPVRKSRLRDLQNVLQQ